MWSVCVAGSRRCLCGTGPRLPSEVSYSWERSGFLLITWLALNCLFYQTHLCLRLIQIYQPECRDRLPERCRAPPPCDCRSSYEWPCDWEKRKKNTPMKKRKKENIMYCSWSETSMRVLWCHIQPLSWELKCCVDTSLLRLKSYRVWKTCSVCLFVCFDRVEHLKIVPFHQKSSIFTMPAAHILCKPATPSFSSYGRERRVASPYLFLFEFHHEYFSMRCWYLYSSYTEKILLLHSTQVCIVALFYNISFIRQSTKTFTSI